MPKNTLKMGETVKTLGPVLTYKRPNLGPVFSLILYIYICARVCVCATPLGRDRALSLPLPCI